MFPALRKLRREANVSVIWAIDRLISRIARPDVVFIGDSITQFWIEADPRLFWPRRVNRGISGDTTAQMLERFARDVVSLRPKAVHIMGGTNDLWRGIAGPDASHAMANLVAMADAARARGIRVVLASPPPIAPYAEHIFAHPELVPVMRAAVRDYCRSTGLLHVDYARSLTDEAGVLRRVFTTDGVHLSKPGYVAIRNQAGQILNEALRRA